jgi:YHS domain-containing protein
MKITMNNIIPIAFTSLLLVSCNPAKTKAITTDSVKPYTLDTCLVSGEKLGGMGKPFEIVHEGQQIKFCCKSCLPDFEKDPAKYLAKLK